MESGKMQLVVRMLVINGLTSVRAIEQHIISKSEENMYGLGCVLYPRQISEALQRLKKKNQIELRHGMWRPVD